VITVVAPVLFAEVFEAMNVALVCPATIAT
jgi:hypothetical protein